MEEGKKLREQKVQELKRKQAEAEATASVVQDEEEPPALGGFPSYYSYTTDGLYCAQILWIRPFASSLQ